MFKKKFESLTFRRIHTHEFGIMDWGMTQAYQLDSQPLPLAVLLDLGHLPMITQRFFSPFWIGVLVVSMLVWAWAWVC